MSSRIGPREALLVVVGVLAISASAILIRIADAPALTLAFWRNAGGALLLAPLAVRSGIRPTRREAVALAATGTALAAHFALFIGSLSFTTVASSVVLATSSPLVVGLVAAVRGVERPTRRGWAGIVAGVGGAALVALGDAGGSAPAPLLGDAMAFAATIAVAGYYVAGRTLRRRLPVAVYAGWVYLAAAVVLLAASAATATPLLGPAQGGTWSATTWWSIVGLVVGPQLLGHTVFNALLGRLPASVVALTTVTEPIGAALLAAVLLSEAPSSGFWLGAPLILAGVVVGALAGASGGPPPPVDHPRAGAPVSPRVAGRSPRTARARGGWRAAPSDRSGRRTPG